MSYCCSQCGFTTQFESALIMHHQLHHETSVPIDRESQKHAIIDEKANTVPRAACMERPFHEAVVKGSMNKLGRTSSATRLLGKLRARICRSKTLFSHPEEGVDQLNDLLTSSECSSRALNIKSPSSSPILDSLRDAKLETYSCHLCSFDADRITVLDRHLLTDHKLGLENLLKLVMAKTKDGLSDDIAASKMYGIRTPYYKPQDEVVQQGEFIIETVTPKIKILKHAAVNTDLKGSDIAGVINHLSLEDDVDKLAELNSDSNKTDLLAKMNTLNECMCKFVDSSNVLKKVLTKEFDHKTGRTERANDSPVFDLGLGDQGQETPRNWERSHSEKLERSRSKCGESRSGSEKLKNTSDSFYF